MKLLLVDDDAFLRDMYAMKFKESGDEVLTAQNGAEALRILNSEEGFDIVLMDMVMPGMTGKELIEKIKAEKKTSKLRCLVLSNQGEQSDVKGAMEAGAIGYVVKAESVPSEVVAKVHALVKAN